VEVFSFENSLRAMAASACCCPGSVADDPADCRAKLRTRPSSGPLQAPSGSGHRIRPQGAYSRAEGLGDMKCAEGEIDAKRNPRPFPEMAWLIQRH